ncbi:hypothetical protein H0X06_00435 [Candidatus Dependentiae bacterium]|nr:hypothetical protein [Candidatus Dependentiae bacterium]
MFKDLASRGKTRAEGFFGFKPHLVANSRAEIVDFMLTLGNVADTNA